jgi:hypothetical protein
MHDPAARAIQERFIGYAQDLRLFRDVLRNSSDAEQRALAAEILWLRSEQARRHRRSRVRH